MSDLVNNPPHYTKHGIECIDVIEDLGLDKHFHLANAFKYIWRHKYKGKPIEDIKKAIWYIERYIPIVEDSVMSSCESGYDSVVHPKHYKKGRFECIDVLEKTGLYKDYYISNAIKYLWRFDIKEDPKKDLEKCVWYLKRFVSRSTSENLEKESNNYINKESSVSLSSPNSVFYGSYYFLTDSTKGKEF